MLLSHLLILSLVCVTINGQVRGTFKCSRNPDAGATTPKADATTTNVGATTTKAGTTTNQAGATTTKAEATTTTPKADAPTTNVGATTTNVGATTTKAGATTNQAGATTNKAEATTTNVEATTTKASTNYNGACSSMSIVNGSLTDCRAIYRAGCKKSGIYKITPNGWTEGPFEAYCDMETLTVPNLNSCHGHGWTVFQRRVNGSVNFNRNWTSYKDGFGQLDHEFWLGNKKLHYLSQSGKCRLRIDLVSSNMAKYHACYREFHIKDAGEQYKLHVSGFIGTNSLEDGLEHEEFSTYDKDNDKSGGQNCADIKQGGWWYKKCRSFHTNLNGVYGSNQDSTSIYWKGLPGEESIMSSEMKIRHYINCT